MSNKIGSLFVFPNSIVKHRKLGAGIVSHHARVKDRLETFVMWENTGDITVAPHDTVLIETSQPSRGLPTLQSWVEKKD